MRDKGSDAVLEYAAIFDKEIEAKDHQLTEAENEIARLRSALMDAGKRSKATGGVPLSVGGEQQLTSDEFAEVVLEALRAQKDLATGRRKDILSAILDANSHEGRLQAKRKEIKSILRGYSSMTAGVRSALQAMGFEISEDGKHYKIIYKGDGRYTFSLPKSGSDHRGGLNAASEISRNIF
ncbi:hypothetical protein [Alteraurantiacibacter palmitatis]|uniref:Uncharacterized protein n=1 Tax=Alteraurantiacibacter palmitatis TaxID=2054628 RepID=A0ABV7E833_9SPHN